MEDYEIISLYFKRDEKAIEETNIKYGKLCYYIMRNILTKHEDVEECINDTYLTIWNKIPPENPSFFSAYLTKVARNLALKKFEYNSAQRRNSDCISSLDELIDCVEASINIEDEVIKKEVGQVINRFLLMQRKKDRIIFIRRYWYFDSLNTIAEDFKLNEKTVSSILSRVRKRLKEYVKKEGM